MEGGARYLVGALGGLLLFYGASVVLRAERTGQRDGPWLGEGWRSGWVLVAVGLALLVAMFFLGPSEPSPPPFVR